jgi:hypothetical protein
VQEIVKLDNVSETNGDEESNGSSVDEISVSTPPQLKAF